LYKPLAAWHNFTLLPNFSKGCIKMMSHPSHRPYKSISGLIVLMSMALLLVSAGRLGSSPSPSQAALAPITLTVNVAAERKPISPYIYGLNFARESLAGEIDLPLRRWGGNHTTRYNWQNNSMNHGSDWFFHNNIHYDPYTNAPQTAILTRAASRFPNTARKTMWTTKTAIPIAVTVLTAARPSPAMTRSIPAWSSPLPLPPAG
jgi:hypothetical protein